jgi:hypothetical protein
VLLDGRWWEGDLEAYRRDPDGIWRGWVRWSRGPGEQNYVGWFTEDKLRGESE